MEIIKFFRNLLRTWHGRFVLLGLTVGLAYLPYWISDLTVRAARGSAGLPLVLAAATFALWRLWSLRHTLKELKASEGDQVLGHLLILFCALSFPFLRFSLWSQALLWSFVMIGIVISSWGFTFFLKYPMPALLIAITYPKPSVILRGIWEAFTPYQFLERIMATGGAAGLRLIGLPAVSDATLVILPPDGAVVVDWGCNGFSMAYTMAAASILLGVFLKQKWVNIAIMAIIGAILALIFNVPRIMLLAVASIYWGEAAFDFWHGHWGGQIFSSLLFTVYYYAVMAMVNRRPKKAA